MDISGIAMKGNILSPKDSDSDTRRRPDARSSFHVWLMRVNVSAESSLSLSRCWVAFFTRSWGIIFEDDDDSPTAEPPITLALLSISIPLSLLSFTIFLVGSCSSNWSSFALFSPSWFKKIGSKEIEQNASNFFLDSTWIQHHKFLLRVQLMNENQFWSEKRLWQCE